MKRKPILRSVMFVLAAATALLTACQNPVRDGGGHRVARDVVITAADDADNVLMRTQDNQWVGGPLAVPVNGSREVRIFFVGPTGERFQLPTAGASYTLYVATDNAGIAGYEPTSTERGRFVGRAAGATTARVYLWHGVHPGGHDDYVSPELTIQVVQ